MELLTDIQNFIKDNDMVVLGIIAIVVSILIYLWGRRKKGFSYYIESVNAVVSVEEKVAHQVRVFFGKIQVENVHIIVMNIRNSGNQSILVEDFINPVTFNFGKDSLILLLSVVETEPPNLTRGPTFFPGGNGSGSTFELEPLLLNGGDNMTVNFLVSNWDPDALEVKGRIVGVKDIKLERETSGVTKITVMLSSILLISAVILMNLRIITLIQMVSIVIFSYILVVISLLTRRRNKKLYRAYMKILRSFIGI